ncbi:hypothetical protein GGD54_002843 [Rhizobium tropici]|uniref:Uncharacterized protein n=1 Tax=Rhizobium tropici TaxID=398 RepID=A0ABR6QZT7_RHITR|nr:hypothetical protein [Rhizobium tropici]MBB5593862.1 hypothetical protein [Rhizobium tropici]MBB6492438.1 hypothetical protein [Rhizobium tropici]
MRHDGETATPHQNPTGQSNSRKSAAFRPELRKNKEIEHFRNSKKSETALGSL